MEPLNSAYLTDLQNHYKHVINHNKGFDTELWGDEDLPFSVLPPASIWSPSEKKMFFAALARYSRLRPDLIAESITTKSITEVGVYLDVLESRRVKDIGLRAFPSAVELSPALGDLEANQAYTLAVLENEVDPPWGANVYGADGEERPRKRRRLVETWSSERNGSPKSSVSDETDNWTDECEPMFNYKGVMSLINTPIPSSRNLVPTHKPQHIATEVMDTLRSVLGTWLRTVIKSLILSIESRGKDSVETTITQAHIETTLAILGATICSDVSGTASCEGRDSPHAFDEHEEGRFLEMDPRKQPSCLLAPYPVDHPLSPDDDAFEDESMEGLEDGLDATHEDDDLQLDLDDRRNDLKQCRRLENLYQGTLDCEPDEESIVKDEAGDNATVPKRNRVSFNFTDQQLARLVEFRSKNPHPMWEDIVNVAQEIDSDELLIYHWCIAKALRNQYGGNSGLRRHSKLDPMQIEALEAVYSVDGKPSIDEQAQISAQVGLSPLQVYYWFRNRTRRNPHHTRLSRTRKSKTRRRRLTEEKHETPLRLDQYAILEVAYDNNPTPDEHTRLELATRLVLTAEQVDHWFNQRARLPKFERQSNGASASGGFSDEEDPSPEDDSSDSASL